MVERGRLLLLATVAAAAACSKGKPAPPPALVVTWQGDAFKLEGTDVSGSVRVENDLQVKLDDMYHQQPTATVTDGAGATHQVEYFSVRPYFGQVPVAGDGAAPVTVELGLPLTITIYDGRTATTTLGKYSIAPIAPHHFFPPGKPFVFNAEAPDDGGPPTLALRDDRDGMYGHTLGPARKLSDVDLVASVASGDVAETKKCMYGNVGAGDEIEVRFLTAEVAIFDRRTGAPVDHGTVQPRESSRSCPFSVSRAEYDHSPEIVRTDSSDVRAWAEAWLARSGGRSADGGAL